MAAPLITLTTDFGLQDEYVGVVKGVILARAPAVTIVDISHAVPPYDTAMAAYLLLASYPFFPDGTVHLIVVDPGVGGSRDIVALRSHNQFFLAPDNGVLTLILEEGLVTTACRVTNEAIFLSPVSRTFHGRDIFAPLAAYVANHGDLTAVGPAIDPESLVRISLPKPTVDKAGRQVRGQVIHIDRFGNAVSNIEERLLGRITPPICLSSLVAVRNGRVIASGGTVYEDARPGEALLLCNSRGYLEIAVNQGSAASALGIAVGDPITVAAGQGL